MSIVFALQLFQIVLLVIACGILLRLFFIFTTFVRGYPFIPTSRKMAKLMAELAALPERGMAVDLGCGTGALVFALARRYPRAIIHGYDQSRYLLFIARCRQKIFFCRYHGVHFYRGDIFDVDISRIDAVVLFLTNDTLARLAPRVMTMKRGGRVVSYMFTFPPLADFEQTAYPVGYKTEIYHYRKLR